MPATITTHAREENSYVIAIEFTDELDIGCTPTALTWTLSDMDGNVLNGRENVIATPLATTVYLVLSGTDTTFVAGKTNERMLSISWTYSSTYGSAMVGKDQAVFVIDELLKVS